MRTPGSVTCALLLLASGLALGCERAPAGWTPVMEETSTAFLELETERALDHLRKALSQLEEDPSASAAELQAAESAMEHLLHYYLPLVRAREKAYNAYRHAFLGDDDAVSRGLDEIEEILNSMAERASDQRLLEIESLAEVLANARMATASGAHQAREVLETLARQLNQAAVKGDLVLRQ